MLKSPEKKPNAYFVHEVWTEEDKAFGQLVYQYIEPHFSEVFSCAFEVFHPSRIPPPKARIERAKKMFFHSCTGEIGPEYDAIISQVVIDNMKSGVDYAFFTIGYGQYESFLVKAIIELFIAEGKDTQELSRYVFHIIQTMHRELCFIFQHLFAELDRQAAEERSQLVHNFESEVLVGLRHVEETLLRVSQNMSRIQDESQTAEHRCGEVAQQTRVTGDQVKIVVNATGELTNSAATLAGKAETAASAAQLARSGATSAETTVAELVTQSDRISEVVNLIRTIANQTRMLALNATIEAARAGEAGRGFAVVASEVKNLAHDTSEATDAIATRVGTILGSANGALESMQSVRQAVVELDEVARSLDQLGQAQTVTTKKMVETTKDTAKSMHDAQEGIEALAEFSQTAASSTHEMSELLGEVQIGMSALEKVLIQFLATLRGENAAHADDPSSPSVCV